MSGKSEIRFWGHAVAMMLFPIAYIVASCSMVYAQGRFDDVISFHIPPQPLSTALTDYAAQSGIQVAISGPMISWEHSPGANGVIDASTALTRILTGTPLGYEVIGGRSVIIVPREIASDGGLYEKRPVILAQPTDHEAREVVVTGSHLRGTRPDSQTLSFSREDLLDAGASSIQEFLRSVPQLFPGGRTEVSGALLSTYNGGRDNLIHGSGVDLRGLGNEATLILINGHRIAPGSFGSFYDLTTVPLSAVERIDVLLDGASAIYGSDAIAGVVNIILRDIDDLIETSARYGGVTNGHLRDGSINQLLGMTWERGGMLINVDYGERSALPASDRTFASELSSRNDLVPAEHRVATLLRARQSWGDALHLSLDAYAHERSSAARQYQFWDGNELYLDTENELRGGTAQAVWDASKDWQVTLAHTYSATSNDRINHLGNLDPPRTEVNTDLSASVTDLHAVGSIASTVAGPWQLALGAERRHESSDLHREFLGVFPWARFNRTIDAGYVETDVPLLLSQRGDGGPRHQLNLSAALRYETASDLGDDMTYRLGVSWSPLAGIGIHATRGTASRAPYLSQYDMNYSAGLLLEVPNAQSPNGTTLLAIAANGPHPDLGRETATTWTVGFDIGPELINDSRLSATYYHIDYDDRITLPGLTLTPFSDINQLALISMPPDPEVFEYVRNAHLYDTLTSIPRELSEAEGTLDARTRNQSQARVSGIDLLFSHTVRGAFGQIIASFNGSYLLSYETQATRTAPVIDIRDTIFNPVDFRAVGGLKWAFGGWAVSSSINYIDDYTDNQLPEAKKVDSRITADFSVEFEIHTGTAWLDGLNLRFNINNAFDRDPPHIQDRLASYGDPGFDTQNADPLDRYMSVQVTKTW